jgi:hypothetical protein
LLNLILLRGIFIKRDKRAGLIDKGNVFKASTGGEVSDESLTEGRSNFLRLPPKMAVSCERQDVSESLDATEKVIKAVENYDYI